MAWSICTIKEWSMGISKGYVFESLDRTLSDGLRLSRLISSSTKLVTPAWRTLVCSQSHRIPQTLHLRTRFYKVARTDG